MTIIYQNPQLIAIASELDYNTPGFDTGLLIGDLPSGSRILMFKLIVQTQFDAGTNNFFSSGISAGGIEFAFNVNLAVAADTAIDVGRAWQQNPLTSSRSVFARYTQSGTAATAGKVHVNILAALG